MKEFIDSVLEVAFIIFNAFLVFLSIGLWMFAYIHWKEDISLYSGIYGSVTIALLIFANKK